MTDPTKPVFPIRIVCAEGGETTLYKDKEELLYNVEDYDSNDPEWCRARVTDALGREVVLIVKIWSAQCDLQLK